MWQRYICEINVFHTSGNVALQLIHTAFAVLYSKEPRIKQYALNDLVEINVTPASTTCKDLHIELITLQIFFFQNCTTAKKYKFNKYLTFHIAATAKV